MRWTSLALVLAAGLTAAACGGLGRVGCTTPGTVVGGMPTPKVEQGWRWMGAAIPTGDMRTSVLTLEKYAPGAICPDTDVEILIRVKNISQSTVKDVVLTDGLPGEGYTYKGSTPSAERSGRDLRWTIGDMPAGAVQEFRVRGHIGSSVKGGFCCAEVTYGDAPKPAPAPAPAPKPAPPPPPTPVAALQVTKTLPADVCLFDEIPIRIFVRNTGNGKATDVKVVDQLPEGWTVAGKPTLSFDVGAIEPGATKELTAKAKAPRTGKFTNKVTVTAAGGLTAQASSDTTVRQAKLELTKTASAAKVILGREATFTLTVKNTGDWPAAECTINDTMAGADVIRSASDGGTISGAVVTWKLGALAPGASRTVTVNAVRNSPGTLSNTAAATGGCAQPVNASASVTYMGIPAILLEVVDNPDPVPVGGTTVYTITVTNQGTAADEQISVVADLEEGVEFVSAAGVTAHTVKGGKITFAPLATLAPKQTVTWTVTARGTKVADSRFKVALNTKETQRPIEETEATRFYQ